MTLEANQMAVKRRWPRLTTHSAISQVIAHAPFGVARISPDMRVAAVNPRLGALLHAEPHDVVGTEIAELVPPDDRVRVLRSLRAVVGGSAATAEFEIDTLRPDGTSVWLRWIITASATSDGTVEHLTATFEDATAAHQAEVAAAAHMVALERLSYLITGFASMVSHETRTALTGIQGLSELILTGDSDPAEVREYAECIFKDAERLNRLLGDLLDLNQMQTRPFHLRTEPVDLNRVVQEAVERFRASNPAQTIALSLSQPVASVAGDPDRLGQVIDNLIRLAARFADKGGRMDVCSAQRDGGVDVLVRYPGNQQMADFDDWLYGRYERFEKNPSSVTGVGLGLAIARVIVERHGGQIRLDSTSGGSSEICFTIPVPRRPPGGLEATSQAAPSP